MSRGTRLELTELPDEWADLCRKLRPDLNPYKAWERFHRYWTGLFGEKGEMKDWRATWRNHITNLKRYPLFPAGKRPVDPTYNRPPERTYPEQKPMPQKEPSSPAYREFQQRLSKFKQTAPRVEHPRFISVEDETAAPERIGTFQRLGVVISREEKARSDREWEEERIAIQNENKSI